MGEELLAKKEVLKLTGISYGQLYRWKRKGLIPEAWFVRRATVTGQETFFPKDKILARIEQIQSMKEARSLDELVQILSPEAAPDGGHWDDPLALSPIGPQAKELLWKQDKYDFAELVALAAGAEAVRGGVPATAAQLLVQLVHTEEHILKTPSGISAVLGEKAIDRGGISVRVPFAVLAQEPVRVDHESRIVHTCDLESIVERVKLALGEVA